MKINNIFILGGALLLGTMTFSSCSKDETYDFDGINYERIYMQNPNTTKLGNALKTPIGYISGFTGKIAVKATGAMDARTNVTLTVDTSLVNSYNITNKTDYKAIPDGVVSLEKSCLTISAGKVVSDTVNIVVSENGYSKLTPDVSYLVPVTIKEVSGSNARLAKESKFRSNYFVLKYKETNSLIRTQGNAGDIVGTSSTDVMGNNWKCIAADDLDPSNFSSLFTGSSWNRKWNFLNGKDVLTASFTVDLGTLHKIGGFYLNCSLAKFIDIKLSTDNSQWTNIGDTRGVSSIYDSNWNSWYAFYASLPGRYVKMTLTLDPNSRSWSYGSRECYINNFKLLLDD